MFAQTLLDSRMVVDEQTPGLLANSYWKRDGLGESAVEMDAGDHSARSNFARGLIEHLVAEADFLFPYLQNS
jgi:hypothetical protein